MGEEVSADEVQFDEGAYDAFESRDDFVTSEANRHEMFQGKNIHSSPVDGKPLCSFSQKMCMQRRLNGFAFCIRHILEDKQAPFKQCQYVTKYNGNKCINPVPVAEERIYCNSHLQVLGLAPKKVKKKSLCLDNLFEENSSPKEDLCANKMSNEICTKNKTKNQFHQNTPTKNCGVVQKSQKNGHESASQERGFDQFKNHFLKRQGRICRFIGNVRYKDVENFKKMTYSCTDGQIPLFKRYLFHSTDEEFHDQDKLIHQSAFESSLLTKCNFNKSCSLDEFLSYQRKRQLYQLRHQHAQLSLSIREKLSQQELSYSVLARLIKSARQNTAATANALCNGSRRKAFRVRKVIPSDLKCTYQLEKNCIQNALPYTGFCSEHIGTDGSQVLFGKCTAKFPDGASCATPVVDFVNERPLCHVHSRKKAESIEKSTAKTPPKKLKKVTEDEKVTKGTMGKKNLKTKLQRKFAIPLKPCKASSTVLLTSSSTDSAERALGTAVAGRSPGHRPCSADERSEFRNKRRAKLREIAQREALSRMNATPVMKENDCTEPQVKNNNARDPLVSPFDMQDDSLSTPSISPTYDMDEIRDEYSRGSLLGIDCNHTDSFDPEDEEMSLQLSKSSLLVKPPSQIPRQVTSPTLNQVSIDSFARKGSLCTLVSPKRIQFGNSTPFSPPRARQVSSPLKIDGHELPFSSTITVGGRNSDALGRDPCHNTSSSMPSGEDERYGLETVEGESRLQQSRLGVISPPREFTLSKSSSGRIGWPTKFTLPVKSDIPHSSGFIRMSPSSVSPANTTIYSPPFGVSEPPHAKAQIFKFDSSGLNHGSEVNNTTRSVELISSKDSVFVPIQERLVIVEKRPEKEPPIERVNPDIFFSPAAFSSTPSSAT